MCKKSRLRKVIKTLTRNLCIENDLLQKTTQTDVVFTFIVVLLLNIFTLQDQKWMQPVRAQTSQDAAMRTLCSNPYLLNYSDCSRFSSKISLCVAASRTCCRSASPRRMMPLPRCFTWGCSALLVCCTGKKPRCFLQTFGVNQVKMEMEKKKEKKK